MTETRLVVLELRHATGRYADQRVTTDPSPPPTPGALPARPPRPLIVHFGVDSAVAFLALVFLGLIFGVPWGITAVRVVGDRRGRVPLHPPRRGARPRRTRAVAPRGAATGVSSESGPLTRTRRVPAYTLPKPRYRGTSHFYALFVAVVAAVALVVDRTRPGSPRSPPWCTPPHGRHVRRQRAVPPRQLVARHRQDDCCSSTTPRSSCMIAGTYTPIALLAMDGTARAATLIAVWVRRGRRHRVRVAADPRAARAT